MIPQLMKLSFYEIIFVISYGYIYDGQYWIIDNKEPFCIEFLCIVDEGEFRWFDLSMSGKHIKRRTMKIGITSKIFLLQLPNSS